jgi:hypothetical protein
MFVPELAWAALALSGTTVLAVAGPRFRIHLLRPAEI